MSSSVVDDCFIKNLYFGLSITELMKGCRCLSEASKSKNSGRLKMISECNKTSLRASKTHLFDRFVQLEWGLRLVGAAEIQNCHSLAHYIA